MSRISMIKEGLLSFTGNGKPSHIEMEDCDKMLLLLINKR